MGFDSSSVASGVGTDMQYKPLSKGKAFMLPMRIAVIAQGRTDTTYPSDKFRVTSADEVAAVMGYGCPARNIGNELFPANGQGVGSIPVTIYPLQDAATGVAATGDLTPSGTQTVQAAYKLWMGGVYSAQWVVPKGALVVNDELRRIGIAISSVLDAPISASYTYGTPTAAPDSGNTGDGTLATLSVTGTPNPGAWTLTCNTAATDAGTFTLTDPDGTVVSTAVSVTGSPQAVAGITFTLSDGTADFVVGDFFTVTVPATKIGFVANWKGVSSNDIPLAIVGDTTLGVSWAITDMNGGLVNPTVDSAIALFGNVWDTFVINALDDADTTALDAFQAWAEGRWDQLVNRPCYVFRSNLSDTWQDASAISSTRQDDRINVVLTQPGSLHMPHVNTAAQVVKIAKMADSNPAHGYRMQKCSTLEPGPDNVQWTFAQRDAAIKAGACTTEVIDGVVYLSDTVTHFAPSGDPLPRWRYVVDGVKLWQLIFNGNLAFGSEDWASAPVIDDNQATTNPTAKTGSMGIQVINGIIDQLALNAILRSPKETKKLTTAGLDGTNPKRFNVGYSVLLSGNANQIPISGGFALLGA